MKKIFTVILLLFIKTIYSQIPPPPPKPPGTNGKYKSYKNVKVKELKENYKEDRTIKKSVKKFEIPVELSFDKNSNYFYEKIESRLINCDSILTSKEIISYTKYKIFKKEINPLKLDSLANEIYQLNEKGKFEESLNLSEMLLKESPNNITGFKEKSFALKRLGQLEKANSCFNMMKLLVNSVMETSEGTRENPYILNNFFEGISIFEARNICYPKKTRFILTKEKQLIGGYDCFHILTFSDLNHYKPYLNKIDYKVEK